MMVIYNLVVRFYGLLIRLSSINNLKAKQWVAGRKRWGARLSESVASRSKNKIVWVHCASYGEFEQGRPLMEAIRREHPDWFILLTFFSPSGFEAFKNWQGADAIHYLPLDTKRNAKRFLELVKPNAVIFIKYEFWLNYLFQLQQNSIPTFLVSAVFKAHHPFFKWYGPLFRKSLNTFTRLFIQDEASGKLLEKIGIKNYIVSGDTRFDRVVEIKSNFQPIDYFEEYCRGYKIIVAGSTWPKDEELLLETFDRLRQANVKLIVAPHHVDEKSVKQTEQLLRKHEMAYSLYTDPVKKNESSILVVNTIGLLNKLYHYADVTYIGGGFNSGIHNCLEPAVYLKPVLFHGGKDYQKYNEALELLAMDAAVNVSTSAELENAVMRFLQDPKLIAQTQTKLDGYFKAKSGTTRRVMNLISW